MKTPYQETVFYFSLNSVRVHQQHPSHPYDLDRKRQDDAYVKGEYSSNLPKIKHHLRRKSTVNKI